MMNDHHHTPADVDAESDDVEHGAVLDDFATVVSEAQRKAAEGRVYDAETEQVRQQWVSTATEAVAEYRRLLEASEK